MTQTTKLGLKKPDPADFYNIADFNYNMDALDAALAGKADGDSSGTALAADTLDGKHAADFLPVTGGTLTGKITVSTPSYPGVNIKETTGGRIDAIENNGAQMRLFNISPEGSSINSTALKLNPETNALVSMLQLMVVAASSASTYSLYGTHNVTVSAAAPTAVLSQDAVAMVY